MTTETSTTNFSWDIRELERETSDGFVVAIDCLLVGTRNNNELQSTFYHLIELERTEDPENFVPYENLTSDIVVGWVEASLGTDTIAASKAFINSELDEAENPSKALGVPWN